MPEKSKTYENIKLPVDIILNGYKEFYKHLPSAYKKKLFTSLSVEENTCGWNLDDSNQFFEKYRQEDIKAANFYYHYREYRFQITFIENNNDKRSTKIRIGSPNVDNVEILFKYFEDEIGKILSTIVKPDPQKNKVTKYSLVKKLVSARVSKDTLLELEKYMIEKPRLLQITPRRESPNFQVVINDSFGEQTLNSISSYEHDLFDDGIKSIEYKYGEYDDALKMNMRLSVKKEETKIGIVFEGVDARDNVETLYTGTNRILSKKRNINFLYHPSFIITGLLFGALTGLILLQAQYYKDNSTWMPIAPPIFILIFLYMFAPFIAPYTTFETNRNKSRSGWVDWGFKAILAAMIGWIITEIF
jgi:hypothetical protein